MHKLKLALLTVFTVVGISSCGNTTSAGTTDKTAPSQPIASQSPQEDIYTMEYKLCGKKCDTNTSQIMTWGKPTEMGIGYFDDRITQNSTKLLAPTNKEKQRGMQTYLMVKCKGTLPGVEEPLKAERFVPTETYLDAITAIDSKPHYGQIQILWIKKIARTPNDNPKIIASGTLKSKLYEPLITKGDTVQGYVTMQSPITPQQVDRITWSEGQPPQVIPVKRW